MNPLHLLWIIPLSVCFGYFIAVLMIISRDKENSEEAVQHKQFFTQRKEYTNENNESKSR